MNHVPRHVSRPEDNPSQGDRLLYLSNHIQAEERIVITCRAKSTVGQRPEPYVGHKTFQWVKPADCQRSVMILRHINPAFSDLNLPCV